ncbi:MAG: hypothetical protein KGH64_00870 [Candidatus Micrarchaeota archaeon]|nr:hypothetical protein [Candidatus Micrarchaeota archaeon]MDE1833868.1 hypothetical protein [Candidatus Micrarchaeota archaeon]MDE1859355.1 hypothetical protein [Candidatus Micrarchaeota archaeon]
MVDEKGTPNATPEDEDIAADEEEEPAPEEGAEQPWDDQTDAFITDIDQVVSQKYNVSLRTLLINPAQYASIKGINSTINDVKTEVGTYFDGLLADLTVEQDELTKALEAADALFTKADQAISSKAAVARVPYFTPIDIDFGSSTPETIYIDQYNSSIDTLITKFINISSYIANLSTTYQKYTIGSWLFSGERSYILEVNRPESVIMTIEDARNYIDDTLDDASEFLSTQAPAK